MVVYVFLLGDGWSLGSGCFMCVLGDGWKFSSVVLCVC